MTDRHAGYIVTLAEDVHEDAAEATINALRMVRGVASVEPVVGSLELQIAESRVQGEIARKFFNFYKATFR